MLITTGGAAVEQQEIKTITIKAGASAFFEEHLPLGINLKVEAGASFSFAKGESFAIINSPQEGAKLTIVPNATVRTEQALNLMVIEHELQAQQDSVGAVDSSSMFDAADSAQS